MTLQALDFSTYYVPAVSPQTVAAIRAAGYTHISLGFDSDPRSAVVLHAFLAAGFTWDAYRFLYPGQPAEPQIDDVVKGIQYAGLSESQLPGYVWVDVEEYQGQAPSTKLIDAAMNRLEAAGVRPVGELCKPGIYSGKWVWDKWYQGYIAPASRGWALWSADWGGDDIDGVHLYGGWTRAEGRQTSGDTDVAGLDVDRDIFRDRGTAPSPVPSPTNDLEVRITAIERRINAMMEALR
jgi:hypothetical protein